MKFKADNVSRDVLNEFITKISKEMKAKDTKGKIYVNTYYKWRSQYRTSVPFAIGDDIRVHNVQGYDNDYAQAQDAKAKFSNFTVYFSKSTPPRAGGCDGKTNDCLYTCLCQYYGGYEHFPKDKKKINTKTKLKKFLELGRNDLIPIESLQKIADYINLNFSVSGDYEHLTTGEYYNTISLTLKNGHYTIKNEKKVNVSFVPKPREEILAYKQKSKNNNETYDEIRGLRENISDLEIREERYNIKSKYVMVRLDKSSKITLKEEHDNFKLIADEVKLKSKGRINLYYYGNDYSSTAKHLLNILSKEIIHCESIDQKEAEWLNIQGGLTYSREYEGEAWCYDINSSYSYEMSKHTNIFPVSKPEFKIVSPNFYDEHGYYSYGIYRAIVSDNEEGNGKYFRFSKENKYTHIDLTLARQLKLPIEIIQDGEHNAMIYSGNKHTGKKLFGTTIDALFTVQESGLSYPARKVVKQIRNSLWGALCQYKKIIRKENKDGEINIPSDDSIVHIDEHYAMTINNQQMFMTNYARIGCFLTAMGRRAINKLVEPYKQYCVRIHTDSMTLNKNVEVKTSNKLGELKLEKSGTIKIRKLNDFDWTLN